MWPFWLKVAIGILNVVLAGVGWLGWARVEDGRRWILWGIVAYFVVFLAIYAHLRKRFCPLVTVATALEANSWMRRQSTSINFRSKENDDNTAQLNSTPTQSASEASAPRRVNGNRNSNFNISHAYLFTSLSSALSMLLTLFPTGVDGLVCIRCVHVHT